MQRRLSVTHFLFVLTSFASGCALGSRTAEMSLAKSVEVVAGDLSAQLGPAPPGSRTLVIDPVLDGRTGQQTRASEQLEQQLRLALETRMKSAKLMAFDSDGAAKSRLLISGTLTALPEAGRYRMTIALTDRKTGIVVAQAAAPFLDANLDTSPTRFYRESPSLVRDRSVEGYLRTSETAKGNPADALYIEQVPTSALLASALDAYNAERWEDALARYNEAVARPDGQQLRTFNGIYLSNVQLGRHEAAAEAFGKIAALGLATNNLAVKLLFRPGRTEFWPDAKISSVYPMWLHQIARAAQTSDGCLDVVGHTSRSGTEAQNDALSNDRAKVIRDWLTREAPGLDRKLTVSGVGWRENIVGTGADDATDAIDRRVEFKVVVCKR
jgi:outer membrane protein OmpA-like peptidoglycan-associated protein